VIGIKYHAPDYSYNFKNCSKTSKANKGKRDHIAAFSKQAKTKGD
jgi:hypothetical protein